MLENQKIMADALASPGNDLEKLRAIQHSIVRLAAIGTPARIISESLGCSLHIVHSTLKNNLAKARISDLQRQMDDQLVRNQARIAQMADTGISFYEDILEDRVEVTPSLKMRVVESVLDRSGHGKTTKTESKNVHAHVTANDLERWRNHDDNTPIYETDEQPIDLDFLRDLPEAEEA